MREGKLKALVLFLFLFVSHRVVGKEEEKQMPALSLEVLSLSHWPAPFPSVFDMETKILKLMGFSPENAEGIQDLSELVFTSGCFLEKQVMCKN